MYKQLNKSKVESKGQYRIQKEKTISRNSESDQRKKGRVAKLKIQKTYVLLF